MVIYLLCDLAVEMYLWMRVGGGSVSVRARVCVSVCVSVCLLLWAVCGVAKSIKHVANTLAHACAPWPLSCRQDSGCNKNVKLQSYTFLCIAEHPMFCEMIKWLLFGNIFKLKVHSVFSYEAKREISKTLWCKYSANLSAFIMLNVLCQSHKSFYALEARAPIMVWGLYLVATMRYTMQVQFFNPCRHDNTRCRIYWQKQSIIFIFMFMVGHSLACKPL